MKKLFNIAILTVSIFVVLVFGSLTQVEVNAAIKKSDWKNVTQFDSAGEAADNAGGDGTISGATKNIVATIINVVRIVGTGVAIIMITYVAIKYMSAAPAEKAEFKKSATAYIVGAIVLFAATNIIGVIAEFATTNIKEPTASSSIVRYLG